MKGNIATALAGIDMRHLSWPIARSDVEQHAVDEAGLNDRTDDFRCLDLCLRYDDTGACNSLGKCSLSSLLVECLHFSRSSVVVLPRLLLMNLPSHDCLYHASELL